MKTLYQALFISDTHIPVNNKVITGEKGSLFKLIEKKKFKKIFHIGDLVCFDDFSSHDKIAGQTSDTIETFVEAKAFFSRLRKSAGAKTEITYVEGNHELRFERYLVRKAPELLPLNCLTLPELFELKKYNIKWKPYRERLVVDGLKVTHGSICRGLSGNSARGELKSNKYRSGVSGHTHRLGLIHDADGAWMELGNLADPDPEISAKYMGDRDPDWQQGFGMGTCCEDEAGDKHWFLHPIQVKDNKFTVDGICY